MIQKKSISPEQLKKMIRRLGTQASAVGGPKLPVRNHHSPDEQLGDLFRDVQLGKIHGDGKTFVDAVPQESARKIMKAYRRARQEPDFNLEKFVHEHFDTFIDAAGGQHDSDETPKGHIETLWSDLTRFAETRRGSLFPLPYPYVVPGGRFQEQFYWDSYFIMIGLEASNRYDLLSCMMRNYTFMIRRFGFIPTANRTYFTSRSQPPVFAHMIELMARRRGKAAYLYYLPYLLREYQFWMNGHRQLSAHQPAINRVVRMPDGSILNRYYDNKATPRPESYYEDVETARLSEQPEEKVFRDIRAAAESGWDFSSRWLRDQTHLSTIYTTDIVPIDLNCLLYDTEILLAKSYRLFRQNTLAKRYTALAEKRKAAIQTYLWNDRTRLYHDYDFVAGHVTPAETLASSFGLFSGIATSAQAAAMGKRLERDFLKTGGLVTTLVNSGQQWDAPNGWAPLQWIAYVGSKRYGLRDLAQAIRERWVATNIHVFEDRHKMVEKYDVEHPENRGGGGEYPLQDGFGWTNGVLLAMLEDEL